MSETVTDQQATDKPLTICGVAFEDFPRPFKLKELQAYHDIADKHDLEEKRTELSVKLGKGELESQDARLETIRENIKRLEDRRDREYDRDELRPDVITLITEQLVEAREEQRKLSIGVVSDQVTSFAERQRDIEAFMEFQGQVYLEAAHAIAELNNLKVPKVDEWLASPTVDDYNAAAELVEEGLIARPLNRAQRRARKKGSSN